MLSPLIYPQYYFQIIHTRMVELQPISTGTQSNSTTSSSNNSISSSSSCSSPTQPSPISLLPPPNFPIMRPPLLPPHPYSPSPLNPPSPYPLNHPHPHPHPHQAVYIQFPQQPYLVHPYFDHFCYYTNPLPPDYLPPHHHQPHADQYHFYPQPRTTPAGGPQHGVAVAYSYGGDGGGCDGGAEEVVDPALDHHYGGDRRWVAKWGRSVSRRFTSSRPRHFHGGRSNFGRCRVKKTWKPKEASSNSVASPSPASPMNCTTLMIKNIPNRISRRTLINLLESHCRDQNEIAEQQTQPCRSEFDFLYLPFDFKRWRNLGYAFVNFTTVEGASRLYSCWNGIGWDGCPKIREITRARLQGKERCKKHFQISVFKCRSEEYLPVVFSPPRDGWNSRVAKMTNVGTRIDR